MTNDSTTTSEALIASCANGDATALRALYDRTAPKLLGVLIRILVRKDLAEEALQDVFVSIWRNAASYRANRGSAFTWMVSIARHRALDIRRSRRPEINVADIGEYWSEDRDIAEVDLDTAAQTEADVRRLRACLNELTLMQRNSICLAYLHGLTHQEVSATLETPLGTVKSWLRRGLQSLRDCLKR